MKNLFADIIVANTNVDRPFTYLIPMNLRDKVTPGCPVWKIDQKRLYNRYKRRK